MHGQKNIKLRSETELYSGTNKYSVPLIHVQIFEHFQEEKSSSVLYVLSMCETSSELFKHYKAILLTGDLRPHLRT